jgi:hypothetical protein
LAEVESRIARLLRLREELSRMVSDCQRGEVAACRVIEALASSSALRSPRTLAKRKAS